MSPRGGPRPGAGRPPGRDPERSVALRVRCSPSDLSRWKAAAEAAGKDLSTWVRDALHWTATEEGDAGP